MATNPVVPDVLYFKQREATLPYEDARFNSMLANVPNYYSTPNDYSLYGCFLRALAMELARYEYMYAYDIVGLEPQYLTPPDIRRRWAAPLFISKSYPKASPSDIDYKTMLVNLLQAYPLGATLDAINKVITAYTGKKIVVQELYKLIGNGIYDDSDRNTIKLSLDISGGTTNPFANLVSAATIATLAEDLYTAIDLAKPAHIGLDFTVTFGSGEDMSSRIHGIQDHLEIVYHGVEKAPLPDVFTLAPITDSGYPTTTLTPQGNGVLAPLEEKSWAIKSDVLKIYRLG